MGSFTFDDAGCFSNGDGVTCDAAPYFQLLDIAAKALRSCLMQIVSFHRMSGSFT